MQAHPRATKGWGRKDGSCGGYLSQERVAPESSGGQPGWWLSWNGFLLGQPGSELEARATGQRVRDSANWVVSRSDPGNRVASASRDEPFCRTEGRREGWKPRAGRWSGDAFIGLLAGDTLGTDEPSDRESEGPERKTSWAEIIGNDDQPWVARAWRRGTRGGERRAALWITETHRTLPRADKGLEVEGRIVWQPAQVGEHGAAQRPGGRLLPMRKGGCARREAPEREGP